MGLCGGKSAAKDRLQDKRQEDGEEVSACGSKSSQQGRGVSEIAVSVADTEQDAFLADLSEFGARTSNFSAVAMETSLRRIRMIKDSWGNIADFYTLDAAKLGQGAFGFVCKGTSHETGNDRAIKSLSKARARDTRKRYRQEILIMKITDHPNIIKLYETFEDKQHVFLVMELCTGGDLFDHLGAVGNFGEKEGAVLMQQILRPVFYMHEKRICHRDIKPENFLFLTKDPVLENTLKLIDFGFSCTTKAGSMLSTKLGTPRYSSPQVLAGQYDQSCDVWSCGVIMYVMMCGQPPFVGKTDAEVMLSVKRGNYAFKGPIWEKVSEDAKDMVRNMLRYQPQDRATAEQALQHTFLQEWAPQRARGMGEMLTPSLLMDLRSFCAQSQFRRAALQIVAQQLSVEDSSAFRRAFVALDSRGAGILTVNGLKESVAGQNVADIRPELEQVVSDLGADDDGEICFTDFLAATLEARHYLQEGACRAAFRAFDRNGDGRITQNELEEVLLGSGGRSQPSTPVNGPAKPNLHQLLEIEGLLKAADTNGDGVIDFQEFRRMLAGDKISAV